MMEKKQWFRVDMIVYGTEGDRENGMRAPEIQPVLVRASDALCARRIANRRYDGCAAINIEPAKPIRTLKGTWHRKG